MKQPSNKPPKVFTFLIWIFWIPIILFCSDLLIETRKGSAFSFFCLSAILLGMLFAVEKISKYLEKTMFKEANYTICVIKQFLYGFLIPLCLFVLFATVYDKFFDENAIQRAYLIKELLVIVIFLYITNVFYLTLHVYKQLSLPTHSVEVDQNSKGEVFVYDKGAFVSLCLMEIALIYQKDQINWVITLAEEEYVLEISLKRAFELLNIKHFFKINRKQIVNKEAVQKIKPASFGKIDLILKINEIKATVSKDRAKDFREWYNK